jgi:hypothetical protein
MEDTVQVGSGKRISSFPIRTHPWFRNGLPWASIFFVTVKVKSVAHFPSLKSVTEHFGRDPAAISQGVRKLESRLREDKNLGSRITELAENLAKGRKPILI